MNGLCCVQSASLRFFEAAKTYGTTNLAAHLKNNHAELLTEYEKKVKEAKEAKEKEARLRSSHHQLSLPEHGDRVRPWTIDDDRAEQIYRSIGEMIALDCHLSP